LQRDNADICIVGLQIIRSFPSNALCFSSLCNSKIMDTIVSFMESNNERILSLTLSIVSVFVTGGADIIQKILNCGFLRSALLILKHCKNQSIKQQICLILGDISQCDDNITIQLIEYTECESIICGFLRSTYPLLNIPPIILGTVSLFWDKTGEILRELCKCCLYDDDCVKRAAGVVLTNIVSFAKNDAQIIHFMVRKGVIGALRAVMKTSSARRPLIQCMKAFDIIMSHSRSTEDGNEFNYIQKVEKVGCVEIFDILQAGIDDRDKVFFWSDELLQKYWPKSFEHSAHRAVSTYNQHQHNNTDVPFTWIGDG